jgi:seryl-tRNA(Sec) selenium transferase
MEIGGDMANRSRRDSSEGLGLSRREFVAAGAAVVAATTTTGCAGPSGSQLGSNTALGGEPNTTSSLQDNIYTRLLGVRPHLGAHEHITTLGGCRMPPEVMEAMLEANDYFVDMHELNAAAGRRVAEIMDTEAALVTSGGFSGMLLGAAACLTGTDPERVEALPHPTWPKRKCLIQTSQSFSYDHAYKAAGMDIEYFETREELGDRIDGRTAMLATLSAVERGFPIAPPKPHDRTRPPDPSVIMPEEFIRIGKEAGVPVLVDMASDLPPWENLEKYVSAGADMVVISGGKGLLGPQSTGILAGRQDLIAAATLNASPNDGIGRGMKVGKEEIIALIVALERAVSLDQGGVIDEWNARAHRLADQLQGIEGLHAEFKLNTAGYGDVDLSWDETVIPLTMAQVKRQLKDGEPRVVYDGTSVRTRLLREGEEQLVAARLRAFFEAASRL